MARGAFMHAAAEFQPALRALGIDAEAVFFHPQIVPWRRLPDRENCILDATLPDGSIVRWHVKRYPAIGSTSPAEREAHGHALLNRRDIPTMTLIAHGALVDRRSFVIFDDLSGYTAADKLLSRGENFDALLNATADLAAKLHRAGLHHRDLYLCHFFSKENGAQNNGAAPDVRLIDVARVRALPRFFSRRWIVKDLAQFWYSAVQAGVSETQRLGWVSRYAQTNDAAELAGLRAAIERKAARIASHDAYLSRAQPRRNISIPAS